METRVISVKQLNTYVKSLLEGDPRLSFMSVAGEISNYKSHYASGHRYFTLKDADASIRCVMFRGSVQRLSFEPEDGMQVIVRGRVSVYERDGQYQLYAEDICAAGAGDIAVRFEQLKKKLAAEGLFDAANKRPIPRFPSCVGVVTSPTGAAVRDITSILGRRFPTAEIVLCPVSVQGDSAVPEMIDALDRLYALDSPELIIIGRGGGSAEDLQAFNDERLARMLYDSPVPVISAVGHETDFTICDFVADLRAPTPSAAAELAVPDTHELTDYFINREAAIGSRLRAALNYSEARLDTVCASPCFKHSEDFFTGERSQRLDRISERMRSAALLTANNGDAALGKLAAQLDGLSPLKTLARGYSVCLHDGKTVRSADELAPGDEITVTLLHGSAGCRVNDVVREKANV